MHHVRRILVMLGIVLAIVAASLFVRAQLDRSNASPTPVIKSFQVFSTAYSNGGVIPERNTCKANNVSPQLTFANVPKTAKTLALIMHDLDAPGGDFTHWLVWNIPTGTKSFNEGSVIAGAVQGTSDFGTTTYGGPCPSTGTHRYVLDAYALDTDIKLTTTARRPDFDKAIKGHSLAQSSFTGTVTATANQTTPTVNTNN